MIWLAIAFGLASAAYITIWLSAFDRAVKRGPKWGED
jgi:hypothetical protein